MKPPLPVLTGCTAVGKTEYALRWAEENDAEIVSCDSLLFYRGMNIGTAKPTKAELARVRHHLIDVCEVSEQLDVAQYVARARAALEEIHRRGKRALVAGGSGFYLKAYFAAVVDDVEVPAEVRNEVRALSHEEALARLRALNPSGLGALDAANPRRVLRALERCLASGRELKDLLAEFAAKPSAFADYDVKLTVLDRDPDELNRRIDLRVDAMLREGLVEEVRGLLAKGLRENPSAVKAIGYREVIAMLDGEIEEKALAAEIAKNTRALVKKQRTWFKAFVREREAESVKLGER